ncbi:MAG: hypothetical protein E4H47_01140 [Parcubacteria group bacterium]|nr:MAG: hypothetical protein E4H47_01140 [Parcubacteria group bacterium]
MEIRVPTENSLSRLLHDFGCKYLCYRDHNYPVNDLDSRIIERRLTKKQTLNFPIYVSKNSKGGRHFLTNPGVFTPPSMYYFFKEAQYRPDDKTFIVRVNVVKSYEEGISPGKGCEK